MNHQDGGLSDVSIKRGTDRENVSTVVAALVELGAEWITVRRPKHRVQEGALYGEFIVTGTVGAEVLEERDDHTETLSDAVKIAGDRGTVRISGDPQAEGGWSLDKDSYDSEFRGLRVTSNPVVTGPDTAGKELPKYPPAVRSGDCVLVMVQGEEDLKEGFIRSHDFESGRDLLVLGDHPADHDKWDFLRVVHCTGDIEVLNPEPLSGISAVWEAMLTRRERGLDECLGL